MSRWSLSGRIFQINPLSSCCRSRSLMAVSASRPLEARRVPHLLVGGRSFHNRAEIETLRAALDAIEWLDDELSVLATLRGALFATRDEELLASRARAGNSHPFRIPNEMRLDS